VTLVIVYSAALLLALMGVGKIAANFYELAMQRSVTGLSRQEEL
jgi:hypothetical protein